MSWSSDTNAARPRSCKIPPTCAQLARRRLVSLRVELRALECCASVGEGLEMTANYAEGRRADGLRLNGVDMFPRRPSC